jgi:pimeloyl-ACP methyl ester carboxylesterase
MIAEVRGSIDYDESGEGASVVFVPGSCSTGAVWRPIIGIWNGQFRCVTTSLLGYGGTAERRSARDPSITHEAEVVEAVVRKAGGRVHLVGHSFGGFVALAVALRNRVALASLVILEAPAVELLRDCGEDRHYQAFREMTAAYFASFGAGDREAIAAMIDFYGGPGTYASWPARVKTYAVETTPVNILDWASAYGFALTAASLASIEMPTLIVWGSASHHAVQRSNALLREHIREATHATLEGAAHFMISTHPDQVSRLIAAHVCRAEAKSSAESDRPGLPKRPGAELQRNTTASP